MKLRSQKRGNHHRDQPPANRRLTERIPSNFPVIYSGMHSGNMLMSDGAIRDCSMGGIGISGNRPVTPGMELALFIDVPGTEEPLCIAQSRVSWVSGQTFGVDTTPQDQNELRFHAWNAHVRRVDNRQ